MPGLMGPSLSLVSRRGGSAFTPASIAGLVGWFDYSDASTVTLSGSEITDIDNKVSGASAASRVTTGPTLILAGQNGLDYADFGGAPMTGTWDAGVFSAGWGATAFVVHRFNSNQEALFSANDGTNNSGFSLFREGGLLKARRVTPIEDAQIPDADNTWRVCSARYTETSASSYINNVEVATNNDPTTAPAIPNYTIGQLAGSYSYGGDMGEVLVFNRALSDSERDLVYESLRTKWNL